MYIFTSVFNILNFLLIIYKIIKIIYNGINNLCKIFGKAEESMHLTYKIKLLLVEISLRLAIYYDSLRDVHLVT